MISFSKFFDAFNSYTPNALTKCSAFLRIFLRLRTTKKYLSDVSIQRRRYSNCSHASRWCLCILIRGQQGTFPVTNNQIPRELKSVFTKIEEISFRAPILKNHSPVTQITNSIQNKHTNFSKHKPNNSSKLSVCSAPGLNQKFT